MSVSRVRSGHVAALAGVMLVVTAAAGQGAAPGPVRFTDASKAAGIRFVHHSGAFGKKYLPETMGSGCAFLDADGDGWQDAILIDSTPWPGQKGPRTHPVLYRNRGDGTFEDVSGPAGLSNSTIYGMGVTAADYDNDGRTDIYITAVGPNHLFHNEGGGRFRDVTEHAGVGDPGFSTSAVFFDYDRDGFVDLFIVNYVEWSLAKDLFCTLDGTNKSYCTPESYRGQSPTLYRNRGNGTFEDVTARAGLHDPSSKALGVTILDLDSDGWLDLFVANDTQPNKLYRNTGQGTFTDVGVPAGVAFSEDGVARAGMGVDAGDYDWSGHASLLIGNFANEMTGLYHNEGNGLFVDEAPTSIVGQGTYLKLTFGCFFFDFDLDGWLDFLGVNGHLADDIHNVQPQVAYAQSAHLFRNLGGKKFEDYSQRVGPDLIVPIVGRGGAYADYDGDGDLDVLLTANNGPARLLRNDSRTGNHWLRVRAIGTRSNRDGVGARVSIRTAGGLQEWNLVRTGSSYCSQSELPITFGLGDDRRPVHLEVHWPSKVRDVIDGVAVDQAVTVREGSGRAEPSKPRR